MYFFYCTSRLTYQLIKVLVVYVHLLTEKEKVRITFRLEFEEECVQVDVD